jgi:hypothetical protein
VVDKGCFAVESDRYFCLDLLRVSWHGTSKTLCDCAILLEIWEGGGVLQTSNPIAEGSVVDVTSPQGAVQARVNSCTADDYGCIIEIEVDPSVNWFPGGYNPPYIRPSEAA